MRSHCWKRFTPSSPNFMRLFSAFSIVFSRYLKLSKGGHTPHTLKAAFAFHEEFNASGDMQKTDFSKFA